MDTITGTTAIDTLYELKGFQLAGAFYANLAAIAFAVFIAFGIVQSLYGAADEHRYRKLVVYIVQAILVLWLLQPVRVNVALPAGFAVDPDTVVLSDLKGFVRREEPSLKAPRLMVWSHIAIDSLSRVLAGSANSTFIERPYSVERAALLLRRARIEDSDLRRRYQAFVVSCYVPVWNAPLRIGEPDTAVSYNPFAVPAGEYRYLSPYTPQGEPADEHMRPLAHDRVVNCSAVLMPLQDELLQHVKTDPAHRELSEMLDDLLQPESSGRGRSPVPEKNGVLLKYVLYNETMGLLSGGEIGELAAAVPEYNVFNTSQQTASHPQDAIDWARSIVSFFVKGAKSVDQWIDHHAEGPALYYKVVCYAPYVYGLTSMILLAIFPFAALVALLPGRWTTLLVWVKYVLWVKLWLVFWAILAGFNAWRVSLDDLGSDPSNGIGDQTYIFPAIAMMYLVTPALSLVVVQLLSAAARGASNAIGSIVPGMSAHVPHPSPQGGGSPGAGGSAPGGGSGSGAGATGEAGEAGAAAAAL